MSDNQRIANVILDERTVVRRSAQIEHERQVAIYDLVDENTFRPLGGPLGGLDGPYNLHLSIEENRLVFDVQDLTDRPLTRFTLPLGAFRKLVKDYFVVCESYYSAIKTASPSKIEAIDMGRRSLHGEGGDRLIKSLKDKVDLDVDTARRLFTLICVLHIRA